MWEVRQEQPYGFPGFLEVWACKAFENTVIFPESLRGMAWLCKIVDESTVQLLNTDVGSKGEEKGVKSCGDPSFYVRHSPDQSNRGLLKTLAVDHWFDWV